jgi:hypothetical protein
LANDTLLNKHSPVQPSSDGTVTSFPDVCKTPMPGGPAPLPYTNIARSADLASGSRSVTVAGEGVCLSDSYIATSTGDEPGSVGGFASGKVKGRAHPVNFSFDVKIEGRGVSRNLDLFTSNDRNTPPTPIMQPQVAPPAPAPAPTKAPEEKCPFCGKAPHDIAKEPGNNVGSSAILERRIFKGKEKNAHPWFAGPFSLQAHHLICSEAVDGSKWATICQAFGYDVNHRNNGVMLPSDMQLACQTFAPLHRGPHTAGTADGLPYPKRIGELASEFKKKAARGAYCANPGQLLAELDALSAKILARVDRFDYTLTADGADYNESGSGCSGVTRVPGKPAQHCPKSRRHDLKQGTTRLLIRRKTFPLKVGQ